MTEILNLKVWNKVTKTRFVFSAMTILLRSDFGRQACSSHHPIVIWFCYWFSNSTKISTRISVTTMPSKICLSSEKFQRRGIASGTLWQSEGQKLRKSAKLPWYHNIKPSFWTFCLFVFLLFCLFVFVFFVFCLDITLIKCLKGLKPQKSLIVSKF